MIPPLLLPSTESFWINLHRNISSAGHKGSEPKESRSSQSLNFLHTTRKKLGEKLQYMDIINNESTLRIITVIQCLQCIFASTSSYSKKSQIIRQLEEQIRKLNQCAFATRISQKVLCLPPLPHTATRTCTIIYGNVNSKGERKNKN